MNILKKLTKEYLKMNKKRTLVTIIGIILTGAMISGVTTLGASFQNFLVETSKQDSGDWQACFSSVEYKNVKYIENNNNYQDIFLTKENSETVDMNEKNDNDANYSLTFRSYDNSAFEKLNIKLVDGKFPASSKEVIVSEEYIKTHKDAKIGSTVQISNVEIENEDEPEDTAPKTEPLQLTSYTIVGIIKCPRIEYKTRYAVISYLDINELSNDTDINIYITSKKSSELYTQTEDSAKNLNLYENEEEQSSNLIYNTTLLIYQGVNNEDGFNMMLYSVCGILIAVIAIGSIVVIYNSFAISVSERKKEFGMLASIGATKKQIKKMVKYEGIIVGIIGIPLGILAGIFGIGVTLKIVDGLISPMFNSSGIEAHFELTISYIALLIAAVLIAITIYLSVLIPAKRASKVSPIEAIRGTGDIKIKAKKVKTPKFLRKLYGIEGDLALKNLKRSRKRYRTTVISLTISIVLFLTFNGFVTYMFQGFDAMYTSVDYDYEATIYADNLEETNKIMNDVLTISDTNKIVGQKITNVTIKLTDDNINNSLKSIIKDNDSIKSQYCYENNQGLIPTYIVCLDDNSYNEYIKQIGMDNQLGDNECILSNYVDGLYLYKSQFEIFNYRENEKVNMQVAVDKNTELTIKNVTNKVPYGIPDIMGYAIIVVNNNTLQNILTEQETQPRLEILIESDTMDKVQENMNKKMENYSEASFYGYDVKEQMELLRNLKLIIEIFLYGFIVLISLIGISNIFNTITTNVNLRRREFANLKSMGMTDKSFNKMMNLECLFYGTKALLFGLPIGVGMCYLLSKAFSSEITFMFKVPWSSIGIVIIAVYLIVFITMKYARNKIKKENIIDVLRDDNV